VSIQVLYQEWNLLSNLLRIRSSNDKNRHSRYKPDESPGTEQIKEKAHNGKDKKPKYIIARIITGISTFEFIKE